jgi:hypothetical protein
MITLADKVTEKFRELHGDKNLGLKDAVDALSSAFALCSSGFVCVAYIGKRPKHSDTLYGTGDWKVGESKMVQENTAKRMLMHGDVFKESKERAAVCAVDFDGVKKKEDERIADIKRKDRFIQMVRSIFDAEHLRTLASDNLFGWNPDGRIKDVSRLQELIIEQAELTM